MEKQILRQTTLSEMKDLYIGKSGTIEREEFEHELRMDVLGKMIRKTRKERNLTQDELGNLTGVKKSQISKIENSANSATIDTIVKVFNALKAEIHFSIKLDNRAIELKY